MLDGAGGLEGRERPSKELQRKDATVAGASGRSADLGSAARREGAHLGVPRWARLAAP